MPDFDTDRIALRVYRQTRRRVLERIVISEGEADGRWQDLADRVRRRFRGRDWTETQIRGFLRTQLDGVQAADRRQVEDDFIEATRAATDAVQRTIARLFGRARARGAETRSAADQARDVRDRVAGRITADGIRLSRRFQRNAQRQSAELAAVLGRSIRAEEGVTRAAERFLDEGDPVVELPGYVQDLREAARIAATTGERRIYQDAITEWRRTIERQGQAGGEPGAFTIRSATEQLVSDLEEAQADEVDRVVERWILDRARHQARTIARHETVEAYRTTYQRDSAERPWVKGFRWGLSPRHPRPDICDLYANQDLYGLGPGGYPPDKVPATPHPLCLCSQSAIIDRQHFEREQAREEGRREPPRAWESGSRQTAAQWLSGQPRRLREQILGPTRADIFDDEPGRVLTATGAIVPVHRVLGQPKPRRSRGERVRVRPIVIRDRADGQVRDFPRI